MINLRFREKTNAWPGFVDLFSNLVIILIFLLIVFVFLWTTTNIFNKNNSAKQVAELNKIVTEQEATIKQMSEDAAEATSLLLVAREGLENQELEKQDIENQKLDIASAYETKVAELQQQQAELANQINELTNQLVQANNTKEEMAKLEQQRRDLQDEMTEQRATLTEQVVLLQQALDTAEQKAKQKEVEYIELSNKLNKALADKVAELNSLSQYQSDFYRAVKEALGERTTVKQDGDRFIVSSDILFSSGSYKISLEGKNQIKLLSNVIKDFEAKIPSNIDWIIRVDGHTDKKPVLPHTKQYKNNLELSLLRATAVVNELVKDGVSRRRLIPTGFGELHPVELGNDNTSLQKNRRIELQITNK